MTKSFPCNAPGLTLQLWLAESTSTVAPKSRNISTVISMWGIEGSNPPWCFAMIPLSKLGATRSNADKNWLDALASIVNAPPGIEPVPRTVNGKL